MQPEAFVAVVDDDPEICRSVARVLRTKGFRVQTFESAEQYLDIRHAIEPTCLLADIRMPGLDGLAMHRATRGNGSEVPTVFMTATGDVPTVVEAMKLGASDLLAKPFTTSQLLGALTTAMERARRTDGEHHELAHLWRALEQLTPREAEIAALVASGRLNKQVGALSGITEKTVKVHRARAMRKLGVNSLAEMVRVLDRIFAEQHRPSVHVDGGDIMRPAAVDIMVKALESANR